VIIRNHYTKQAEDEHRKHSKQMRRGILEFCILSVIRRGEAYPSDIVEEMKAAKLLVLEGTLYPLLTRLKNVVAYVPVG